MQKRDFIYNGKTSSGRMTSDGSVPCTRGRGPSLVDVEVVAAEPAPEQRASQALLATAEAEAMTVQWSAVARL